MQETSWIWVLGLVLWMVLFVFLFKKNRKQLTETEKTLIDSNIAEANRFEWKWIWALLLFLIGVSLVDNYLFSDSGWLFSLVLFSALIHGFIRNYRIYKRLSVNPLFIRNEFLLMFFTMLLLFGMAFGNGLVKLIGT